MLFETWGINGEPLRRVRVFGAELGGLSAKKNGKRPNIFR
jgi:hypothetical protein